MIKTDINILKRDRETKQNSYDRIIKKIKEMDKKYDLLFKHENSKYLLEEYEEERGQELIKFNGRYDSLTNQADILKDEIQELEDTIAELE